MRRKVLRRLTFYVGLLALSSCLDTFEAPTDLRDVEVLVVDGFLNGTDRNVIVNISNAQSLSSNEPPVLETGATVSIVDDDGDQFALEETGPGVYSLDNLDVDPAAKYQLRITTEEGGEYHSDYVAVRQAPAITGVRVEPKDDLSALEILLSANDPTQSTRYYRWDYLETWEYTSVFRSEFKVVNKKPTPRSEAEGVYRCYLTRPSTRILIGTSVQLTEDLVSNQVIATIPVGDPRTYIRYSIEVRQRSISVHEFDYLKQLQKSTEDLGGLFDPLPSQVYGNVKNMTDTSVPVLGYFSAGSIQKLRTFYDRAQLPEAMRTLPAQGGCAQDTVCATLPSPYGLQCSIAVKDLTGEELITGTLYREFETIGFLMSSMECADCRTKGGVTTRPDFW